MGTQIKINVNIDDALNEFKIDPKLELKELKKKIEEKTKIPFDE